MVSYKALNTIRKCLISNAGNAVRNDNIKQRTATPKCRLSKHGKPTHPAKDEAERCRSYHANIAP